MNFGQALEALKAGKRVAREGWNGKGMWLLLLVPGEPIGNEGVGHIGSVAEAPQRSVRVATAVQFSGVLGTFRCLPWIGMKTADDGFVPWLASQTDLLAEDWVLLAADWVKVV